MWIWMCLSWHFQAFQKMFSAFKVWSTLIVINTYGTCVAAFRGKTWINCDIHYCDTPLVKGVLYLCQKRGNIKKKREEKKKEMKHLKEKKTLRERRSRRKVKGKGSPHVYCIYAVYSICLLL